MKINESIATLEQLIKPGEEEIAILEEKRSQMEQSEATVRQAVSLADHRQAQTHLTLVRRQEALQSLQRRIEEDFGLVAFDYAAQVTGQSPLPLEGMVEQLPRVVQLAPEIEEGIKRQRAQLRRIGPINPEAQEEYKSVLDRYNFMTEQIADLRRAEVDIREVVQELDGLMEREFNKTFEAVATEFKAIFQRLFGGGMARLVLTDPDNLADTGIDIEARLPGRRTQGLSLLSGGERSLTATSLVFALLKVSPTPFCVLDEVDAMLDEANVGRFRDLLRELSQRTQFIIVTHNRNTVQAADVIYGVTMGRDSASQVVSLRMDQVAQVFE
jgi:chromosome segregation protein